MVKIRTNTPEIRAFIQARMSSTRFPGKVLAPLNGRPIIAHVISRVTQVIASDQITVATSTEQSDDPLASYVQEIGISVYRGPLEDVFARFQHCLAGNACEWFFRICADSPLLDNTIISAMLPFAEGANIDLVTNIQKPTFPHGHSVEMIRAERLAKIDPARLSADEREHVTKFYYAHTSEFNILNLENADSAYGAFNFGVDTIEDLLRMEQLLRAGYDYPKPKIITPTKTV